MIFSSLTLFLGTILAMFWLIKRRQMIASQRFTYSLSGICGNVAAKKSKNLQQKTVVMILGGTGAVGRACAVHMLRSESCVGMLHILLAGRNVQRGETALRDVLDSAGRTNVIRRGHHVSFVPLDFNDANSLTLVLRKENVRAVVHVAGCYSWSAAVLRAAVNDTDVRCYVDVCDQLDVLEEARSMSGDAERNDMMALVSAGAFPGMSNVLAVECASRLAVQPAHDVSFSYFTSGLGGSGAVNLFITNLGFGELVPTMRGGDLRPSDTSGLDCRDVKFFIDNGDESNKQVGTVTCWAWPFPETLTVAKHLGISGASVARMGTAPHIWNIVTVACARAFPRSWWRSRRFSWLWAKISEPMVVLTDLLVPETHAIRVDVDGADGERITAVQAHRSFRVCVGQSVAEMMKELLEREKTRGSEWAPGVYLPEELAASNATLRARLIKRLTSTEGTTTFRFERRARGDC